VNSLTRSHTGTLRKTQFLNLSSTPAAISPIPANYRSGLADANWPAAMTDEFHAFIDNSTWRLVSHGQAPRLSRPTL